MKKQLGALLVRFGGCLIRAGEAVQGSSGAEVAAGAEFATFLTDCCIVEAAAWCRVSDLRAACSAWAGKNRLRFGLSLKGLMLAHGFWESRGRRDARGIQFRAWEGVRLKG